jgi:hypothetical protein
MHPLSQRLPVCIFVLAALLLILGQGCGRSSLEAESVGDAGLPSTCGPSTCPTGCCDAKGVCRTGSDVRACGSVGGRCSDCVANGFSVCTDSRVCGRDDPTCSATSCPNGCCATDDGRRRCLAGTEPGGCGTGGAECRNCSADGRACDVSKRACGSSSCTGANCDGCCVGDKCLAGDIASACGAKGVACTTCAAGQTCLAQPTGGGSCNGPTACGPSTCRTGCCDAKGRCVAGNDTTACGTGGARCAACGFDQVCSPEARACQPRVACGPSNCNGCCVGNQCVAANATTAQACGIGGQACRPCGLNLVCDRSTGACIRPPTICNPLNCPTCCVGDVCAREDQDVACGVGGGACVNCSAQGRVCESGSCQARRCSPATCTNGCCDGNTCVRGGTADNACGPPNGGACTNCEARGEVCQGHQCKAQCGPSNCAGCCRSATECAIGTANDECGSGGASCANCVATATFCNGLVTPRRCNDQQSTCPAPYPSCPSGTATPVKTAFQNVCTDSALAAIGTACSIGPSSQACLDALAAAGGSCSSCLGAFLVPFEDRSGLWACAAASVDATCRRATGCAADCADTSCRQCSSASEDQCVALVNGGQCSTFFDGATTCTARALAAGQPCSPISYPDYGQWLRAVGDHFCGNGP